MHSSRTMFASFIRKIYHAIFIPGQTASEPETRSDAILTSTLKDIQESSITIPSSSECGDNYQSQEISDNESDEDLITREKAVYCDRTICESLDLDNMFPVQASTDNESEPIQLVTQMHETTVPEAEIIAVTEIEHMKLSLTGKPVGLCTETPASADFNSEAEKTADVDGISEIVTRYERYASLLLSRPSVTFKVVDISPASNPVATFSDGCDVDVEIIETQFLVSLSANHATRTSYEPSVAITIDEFRSCESHDLECHRQLVQAAWIIRAVAALNEAGFDGGDVVNIDVAERIVLKGSRPKFNAIPCDCAALEVVYRKYIYTNVEFYQCLLVSAPDNEQDKTERDEEMENFMRSAFPITLDRLGFVFNKVVVKTRKGIENAISSFFRSNQGVHGKNALHALIVFFGHGGKDGKFTLYSSDGGMRLDDITSFVKAEWQLAIRCRPEQLPAKVEIVFGQCHAHLYNSSIECDHFKVIVLTSEKSPTTLSQKNNEGKYYNVKLEMKTNDLLGPQYEIFRAMRAQPRTDGEGVEEATNGKPPQPGSEIEVNLNSAEAASDTLSDTSAVNIFGRIRNLFS